MVAAPFRRKGPWVFFTALSLFLGGNVVLDARYEAQQRSLNKEAPLTQSFGVGGISHVHIHAGPVADGVQRVSVNVIFDSRAKEVSTRIDQKKLALQSESANGDLSLAFQLLKEPGQLEVTLPPSINTLTIDGIGLVNVRSIKDTDRHPRITLVLANCNSDVTFEAAKIDTLRLEQVCSDPHIDEEERHSTFSLENGLDVSTLTLDVKAGKVAVSEKTKVGAATLRLGDEVQIQAPARLLRQARWLQP
jgi:hypothetical protein